MKQQLLIKQTNHLVRIPIDSVELEGELTMPDGAYGLVIFAHGSGSSRHSPRNQFVARQLHQYNLATLLVDLLSESEDNDYQNRFNIDFLNKRLIDITDWATRNELTKSLAIGYFGASTGAAAAMLAAAKAEDTVKVLVSRGGRVDLAEKIAPALKMPTLFIVGAADFGVCEMNEAVFAKLNCEKRLVIVPRATHLFEEPGALETVAEHAAKWFANHLRSTVNNSRKGLT